MQLLKKIKRNYYCKIIQELLNSSNFEKVNIELINLFHKDKKIFFDLINIFFSQIIKIRSLNNFFFKNLVFINSFLTEDNNLITRFLDYYFNETLNKNILFDNFTNLVSQTALSINTNIKNISFQDLINQSINYQTLISLNNQNDLVCLSNQSAFFSTQNSYNFTDSSLVKCFFLIVDHPYSVYSTIKEQLEDKFHTQNFMFNLDNRPITEAINGLEFELVRKDWATFNESWVDPNVVNSLRGVIIKKTDLNEFHYETYVSIIMHLIQSGFSIKLNYDIIDNYINAYKDQSPKKIKSDLTQHEKKFIQKYCSKVVPKLGFEI